MGTGSYLSIYFFHIVFMLLFAKYIIASQNALNLRKYDILLSSASGRLLLRQKNICSVNTTVNLQHWNCFAYAISHTGMADALFSTPSVHFAQIQMTGAVTGFLKSTLFRAFWLSSFSRKDQPLKESRGIFK